VLILALKISNGFIAAALCLNINAKFIFTLKPPNRWPFKE
jgi:hypothetical protein